MFLVPLLCLRYLEQLIMLTPTKNQGGLIWLWISSVLLSVVGYGYVRQLLWEWLLLIIGNYFVMGLRDSNMINLLVSENYHKDLLNIAWTIHFKLILGPRKIINSPWWSWWWRDSFYLPFHSFFQLYLSLRICQHYFRHNSIQCFIDINWISAYCQKIRI